MTKAVAGQPRGGKGVSRLEAFLGPRLDRRAPAAFRFLRRRLPVVTTSRFALVVRDADVRQVLGRREDFSVERYTHKMMEVTGPFSLAFDDEDHYIPARAVIAAAIRADDPSSLARSARQVAGDVRDFALSAGRIDVVQEFLDPVLARLAAEYLGVTDVEWPVLFDWARTVFTEIFVSPTPFMRLPAVEVVEAFRAHIDSLVARRKGTGPADGAGGQRDDVLARLLAAGIPEASVSGTLLGLVVAWIPNASKVLALAVDELLGRPAQLAWAQDATRRGDEEALAAILFEAVRFRPPAPGIFRTATRPCRLGLDTHRPKTIRAGTTVLAATASAMMDPDAVEAPDEFRLDRPETAYLHFGYGLHTCAGQAINRATMPAILGALLAGATVQRAPGRAGRLAWEYPYPSSLIVTVDGRGTTRAGSSGSRRQAASPL